MVKTSPPAISAAARALGQRGGLANKPEHLRAIAGIGGKAKAALFSADAMRQRGRDAAREIFGATGKIPDKHPETKHFQPGGNGIRFFTNAKAAIAGFNNEIEAIRREQAAPAAAPSAASAATAAPSAKPSVAKPIPSASLAKPAAPAAGPTDDQHLARFQSLLRRGQHREASRYYRQHSACIARQYITK